MGVGPDWLMTALPIFKYRNCIHIKRKLVKFGSHEDSITIDAQRDFSSEKAKVLELRMLEQDFTC